MNINEENIGKLFQQKLKDAEVQPDSAVWSAIEQQTHGFAGWSLGAKLALSALVVAIAVSSYFLLQDINEIKQTEVPESQQQEVPVQQQIAESAHKPVVDPLPEKEQEVAPVPKAEQAVHIAPDTKKNTAKKSPEIKVDQAKTEVKKQEKEIVPTAEKEVAKVAPRPVDAVVIKDNKELPPEEAVFAPHLVDFTTPQNTIPEEQDNADIPKVNVADVDTGNIRFSPDPTICFGEDAVLQVFGGVDYEWSNGAHSSQITVSPVEQSTYWVIVHDSLGRQFKHDFTVSVDKECTAVFIPSAFTPNGDGLNDVFKAEGLGVRDFEMIIFSREGKLLFESRSIDNSWDGTYKGELMPPVTYLYQVKYIDAKGVSHVKKGQVTLIR
jgi:gliding motility-associated-like protein